MSSASSSYISTQKGWRYELSEDQRKTSLARIISVDGADKKSGQFIITTVFPGAGGVEVKQQVVVTSSFLKDAGTKKAKLLSPSLFRIGAPVMTKSVSGNLSGSVLVVSMGGARGVAQKSKATYNDLCAIFTEAEEAEWVSEGLL